VAAQQSQDCLGGEEGIGDRPAVVHREGHAKLAIHLRHQQRMRRDGFGAVERGEPLKCHMVVGVSRS